MGNVTATSRRPASRSRCSSWGSGVRRGGALEAGPDQLRVHRDLFATLSVGLVFYLNFKYGFTAGAGLRLPFDLAEVRERDYFFIVSFSMWGLWVGVGLTALWLRLAAVFGGATRRAVRGARCWRSR
jgi:hypothetical protein